MLKIKLIFFILLTMSLGFHAPLPEASAAAGDITAVKTQSEGNNLEHDTDHSNFNSLVQVDSDTYALAYMGTDSDGFITTFTISDDGTTITKVATLEHDTIGNDSLHNSLVQVDSDTYALAYMGQDSDAFISTFTIDSDGNITAVKTQSEGNNLEHDTGVLPTGTDNSFVHVDSDTYALAYEDEGSDGSISTFTISSDGTTITELATLVHDTTRMSGQSLVQVDSDTYALAYSGEDIDGFISTFTIDTARPHKVGTVSPTSSAVLSWTAPTAGDSAITDYVIQYSTDDSNWTTFDDGVSTGTTATVTGLTGGTTYYFRVAAVNSSGTGDFSSSSSVSVTSSSSGGGGNNCDYNGFGKNKSLIVHQVSYDIDTYQVQVQAYSTCGSISAKITTPTQQSILGLSTEQPYLDDMITIYSGFLDESDEKFHIAIQNKKHSFTETFYIHDKSITKKYTGSTGYTSEQQGTALPTITSEQITVVSEPSVTQVVQTIDESIPIEEQILDEPLETPQIQSITYTHEPIVEEEIKPQCGVGTKLVDGICKIIKTDEPKFCFLFWCW